MTTIKTRFIRSIIIACFLALASLVLTLEAVSAGADPGRIVATGANAPPASALASGQTVPLQQSPVLVAVKTATVLTDTDHNGTPSPGDVLLYRVTIKNNGIVPATGVTFSDQLDLHTTLLTGTVQVTGTFPIGPGIVTTGNNAGDITVLVEIGEMPAGPNSEVVIDFKVTIDNPLPASVTQVENRGIVDCDQLDSIEVQVTTDVTAAPVLVATRTSVFEQDNDGDGKPSPGDYLLDTIVITNIGNATAPDVIFRDIPDPNTSVVVDISNNRYPRATQGVLDSTIHPIVGFDLDDIPGGNGTVEISFTVEITNPWPVNTPLEVRNQGLVTSTYPLTVLTNETVVTITTAPVLHAEKKDGIHIDTDRLGEPSPGDVLSYTVTIYNTGNGPVTGVTFSDTLDLNAALKPGSVEVTGTFPIAPVVVISGNDPTDTSVAVNVGTIPGDDPADPRDDSFIKISFLVEIPLSLPPDVTQVENQGDVDCDQLAPIPTDDPDTSQPNDSTVVDVVPMWANLYVMVSNRTVKFKTNNENDPFVEVDIPHLILHQNGGLSNSLDRTLIADVLNIDVPPGGTTVTLRFETQHGDPDQGGGADKRIPVWDLLWVDSQWIEEGSNSTSFEIEFNGTVFSGTQEIDTPTDYFRYSVLVGDPPVPVIKPVNHAFLLENQWSEDLPTVSGGSNAPDEMIVHYCDMFPFGITNDTTWLDRDQVQGYITGTLVPFMIEAFRAETDDWGMGPWYDNSWNDSSGDQLSVFLNENETWFHQKAEQHASSELAIASVTNGNGWYPHYDVSPAGPSNKDDDLLNAQMAAFYHEMAHIMQANSCLHHGRPSSGPWGSWPFFTEGQATLATAIGQPDLQFAVDAYNLTTHDGRQYMNHANRFLREYLNWSYAEQNVDYFGVGATIYWQFLYEQCYGTSVITRSLDQFCQQIDAATAEDPTTIVDNISSVMDVALDDTGGPSCKFGNTFTESLVAFAHANYTLHLQDGRCGASDAKPWCIYRDEHKRYENPHVGQGSKTYTGAPLMAYTDFISGSFGMDFVEVKLDPRVYSQPLTVTLRSAPGTNFHLQVWPITQTGTITPTPAWPAWPQEATNMPGRGGAHYFFPSLDTTQYDGLAFIVTRLDANEDSAPGDYTIFLRGYTPSDDVTIHGPAAGRADTTYVFTATVSPITTTTPITYVWWATGQSVVTHTSNVPSDTMDLTWPSGVSGTQAITVTATNVQGTVTGTHSFLVAIPPDGVAINGPVTGTVSVSPIFTATVSPVTTTTPITYIWQATGQSPVTNSTSLLSDVILDDFTWWMTGTQVITVTALNGDGTGAVTATHTITIHEALPPAMAVISGPVTGTVSVSSAFTVTISPVTTTVPITYTWQASEQPSGKPGKSNVLSDTVSFTWDVTGTYMITLTASNAAGTVTDTHSIFIGEESRSPLQVLIGGPTRGITNTNYRFLATTIPPPPTTTMPITYIWQATEQSVVTHTNNQYDYVIFTWDVTGTKSITVTAANDGGTVINAHVINITPPVSPTEIIVNGPVTGTIDADYTFETIVGPFDVTTPITYTWQATGQPLVTHESYERNDSNTFTWDAVGVQTITVTASNTAGVITGVHSIDIGLGDQDGDGILDTIEYICTPGIGAGFPCDSDGDGTPDYLDPDSDDDFILDEHEAECTLGVGSGFPCDSEAVPDGVPDYRDIDSDGDHVLDGDEAGDFNLLTLPCDENGDGIPSFRDPNETCVTIPTFTMCQSFRDLPWGFDMGVACGLEAIRHTLQNSGINVGDDPPVPGMLFSTTPFPALPEGSAQGVLAATATHTTASVAASFTTSHTVLVGNLNAAWTTDAWAGAQFTSLTVPWAQLYDETNTLVATGTVQARPVVSTAVALALGDTLTYTVEGTGSAAFYAPAVDGLGVGGHWLAHTTQVRSANPYGIGLQGAVVTVDGQEYTGTLVLVTTDTLTLEGQGRTLTPNFADTVSIHATDASVRVSESASQRVGYSGYTGPIMITEYTAELDRVELNGPIARDLSLALDPVESSITPVETTSFQAEIHSNQDDTYTLTVAPPLGWQAQVDATGLVTIIPALDAAPAIYQVQVAVQSQSANPANPLFSTAIHEVTILPWQGLELSVVPDLMTTVPMGPLVADEDIFDINNGQVQVPGAAYVATIINTSSTGHTFDVQVTPDGFPVEWIMLGGAGRSPTTTVTLPAGSTGNLGVYVSPVGLETLPPAGTEYPFTVHATAVDDPALTQSAPETFIMPPIPFAHVSAQPDLVYATPGLTTTFEASVRNVGNVSDTFDIDVTLLNADYQSTITNDQPVILPGETAIAPVALLITDGEIGRDYHATVGTWCGPYRPSADVTVRLVGPCAFEIYQAARAATLLDNIPLSQALENLAFQLEQWEQDPDNTALRDRTVAALEDVIARVQADYPSVDTSDLEALAATPTASGFCAPISDLEGTLTRIAQRQVAVTFQPGVQATLAGQPVTYTLTLENRGTLTTTYGASVQVCKGASLQGCESLVSGAQYTMPAGESLPVPIVVTPTALGYYTLAADVQAVEDNLIQARTTAGLNVVDRFIQVIEVSADPDFVELGPNTTDLYAQVANVAGVILEGMAQVSVISPEGDPVYTNTLPVTLVPSLHSQGLSLGTASTDGWTEGVYTITLDIVDETGDLTCGEQCRTIPNGSGYGHLLAGTGLKVGADVQPALVVPGTVTVTTVITAERTAPVEDLPDSELHNLYTFYLPEDLWHPDHDGFYVVGLRPETTYVVQQFDEAAGSWTHVLTSTVAMDEINLHFTGFAHDQLYRVHASNPLLVVVTSGEGSLVPAATPELKFRGRHFIFIGDYEGVYNRSRAVAFGLEDSTTVTMEVRAYEDDWTTPLATLTRTLDADEYWFEEISTGDNTTVMRVTADRDVIVYRTSNDNDELDTAMSDNGTPYGKVFYFAPVPRAFSTNVMLLFNTEPLSATVNIYGLDTPYTSTVTLEPYGAQSVDLRSSPADYFKIVSDRTLSVIGGGVYPGQVQPDDSVADDAIWEILPTRLGNQYLYRTNIIHSRGQMLLREYTEFDTDPLRDVEIATSIPLIDKSADHLWYANGLNYLASRPFTITLEVISRTVPPGVIRHEENHDVHYTPAAWDRTSNGRVSRGYYARSSAAGATASMSFDGPWVGVGFFTKSDGGQAEVFIDGASYGVVDTYSRFENVTSVYYSGLSNGTHTISITVSATNNDFSSGNYVRLDYFDSWDGTEMAGGTFEQDDDRVYRGPDWWQGTNNVASGGTFFYSGNRESNVWFPFTGDSVTYQAIAHNGGGQTEIFVDGVSQGLFDLYTYSSPVTRTYTFEDLGAGPHILQIRKHRGDTTIDAFITPGVPPTHEPLVQQGVVRYEDDDPALRYNGAPLQQTAGTWNVIARGRLSARYAARSRTSGDTVNMSFEGPWVGAGFLTNSDGGQAEVSIDGISYGVVDTYSRVEDVTSVYYSGLSTGTHTISITVLATNNDFSNNNYVQLDYFDSWDGTEMAGGTFEQDDDRVFRCPDWWQGTNSVASGGTFFYSGNRESNVWFPFTGDSVTYQAIAQSGNGLVEIFVDGVSQGFFDLHTYSSPVTRTYTFDGLGAGPHVLQIRRHRDNNTIDAFITPGVPPTHEPPVQQGVIRYEGTAP